MSRKPTIKKGPASHYAGGDETIVEIWSSKLKRGCLFAVREVENAGTGHVGLVLIPYRADPGVYVRMGMRDYKVTPGPR